MVQETVVEAVNLSTIPLELLKAIVPREPNLEVVVANASRAHFLMAPFDVILMELEVVEYVVNVEERDANVKSCVEAVISNREGQRENAVWPCLY
jgi:pyruvate-formate lyase